MLKLEPRSFIDALCEFEVATILLIDHFFPGVCSAMVAEGKAKRARNNRLCMTRRFGEQRKRGSGNGAYPGVAMRLIYAKTSSSIKHIDAKEYYLRNLRASNSARKEQHGAGPPVSNCKPYRRPSPCCHPHVLEYEK